VQIPSVRNSKTRSPASPSWDRFDSTGLVKQLGNAQLDAGLFRLALQERRERERRHAVEGVDPELPIY